MVILEGVPGRWEEFSGSDNPGPERENLYLATCPQVTPAPLAAVYLPNGDEILRRKVGSNETMEVKV